MPPTTPTILDEQFLTMRAKLIELAATFDRIDREEDAVTTPKDERYAKLREAISILGDIKPDRVERIQMLFSDPYDPNWPRVTTKGKA